jgi:hypothetical protein
MHSCIHAGETIIKIQIKQPLNCSRSVRVLLSAGIQEVIGAWCKSEIMVHILLITYSLSCRIVVFPHAVIPNMISREPTTNPTLFNAPSYYLSLIGGVRLLHSIPIDCLSASSRMVSMNGRVRICSAVTISKAANVHGQTGVRLDDLVVVLSNGLGSRFSAVHVVFRLAVACVRCGVPRFDNRG